MEASTIPQPSTAPASKLSIQSARDLAALPPDKQEQGLRLLQELTELFAGA